nr:hypothetical protein [Pseudomonas fluorescens]
MICSAKTLRDDRKDGFSYGAYPASSTSALAPEPVQLVLIERESGSETAPRLAVTLKLDAGNAALQLKCFLI